MPRKRVAVATQRATMPATALETENGYLRRIVTYAEALGWWWAHIPKSTYRALSGTPGSPDLWLVHPGTKAVMAVEVKLDRGRISADQHAWADVLIASPVEYYLVFQRDEKRFREVLEVKAGRKAV